MVEVFWVAIGGILGSLLRWGLAEAFHDGRAGTLTANLIGVALAGFFLVLMERHGKPAIRHFLLPGFCAGLTTFSTFAFQSIKPTNGGFIYFIETIVLSFLIIALVIPLSRKVVPKRR